MRAGLPAVHPGRTLAPTHVKCLPSGSSAEIHAMGSEPALQRGPTRAHPKLPRIHGTALTAVSSTQQVPGEC